MNRIIISIIGKDKVGMSAKVCTYLAGQNVNILDMNQTILQGISNMMMIVDIEQAACSFDGLAKGMDQIGQEIGADIRCQREEIFTGMHRI